MENTDTLRNLMRAIHDKDAFNYISRGNLHNANEIPYEELRTLFMELCYAVERHCLRGSQRSIVEEMEDNLMEHYAFAEAMPWKWDEADDREMDKEDVDIE